MTHSNDAYLPREARARIKREARAQIKIDRRPRAAGWSFQHADQANIDTQRMFPAEYVVQRFTSNTVNTTARVYILTVQRICPVLMGKQHHVT